MNFLNNLSIGKRLAFGFAVTLALSIVIAAIGVWRLQQVAGATRHMMETPLAKERMISDWYSKIDSAIRRTTAIARSSDQSLGAFFAEESKASTAASSDLQKRIEPLISDPDEKELFDRIMAQRKLYIASRDQVAKLKTDGELEQANDVFEKTYRPAAAQYQALVQDLLAMQRGKIDAIGKEIDSVSANSRSLLTVLAVLAVAFGALCAYVLTKGITTPLSRAVDAARRVAAGDLTGDIRVHGNDETGQLLGALRDMNQALLNIVSEVRNGTHSITIASSEIAAGNQDLSARTEQQAASLEETASSMEELTSTVKQNADNARQANQLAGAAASVARKGGSVVSEVVGTMESIDASSRKIVDIIAVIDGIAFQTNILALNAAVEAARAGEQGRGFAVVASEVRALAHRSASAAKDIKSLISESVSQVDGGEELVRRAGGKMVQVVESVERVKEIMHAVSSASAEQSAGIVQVNSAIADIDGLTQQNTALVEEATAAAGQLQQQAATLAQLVNVFRLDAQPHTGRLAAPGAGALANTRLLTRS